MPVALLRALAAGAYVLLGSIAALGGYTPASPASLHLDGVQARFGVDYDAIGAVNAASPLDGMLAASALDVPRSSPYQPIDR